MSNRESEVIRHIFGKQNELLQHRLAFQANIISVTHMSLDHPSNSFWRYMLCPSGMKVVFAESGGRARNAYHW